MEYEYDDSVHLHLDYFGTECDMESIAYKRKNEDVWDVYFNFGVYGIQKDDVELGRFMDEYAGYYVFSVHARDLSWEFGSAQFEEWVLKNRIVEKTLQKQEEFCDWISHLIIYFCGRIFYYANAYLPIRKEKHP